MHISALQVVFGTESMEGVSTFSSLDSEWATGCLKLTELWKDTERLTNVQKME